MTKLIWITPNADKLIAYMARVSNLNANVDDDSSKLIAYLIKHKHWSPFEMCNMCVEIETTRDITRQILRHRSFHFQEFSQRYAEIDQGTIFSNPRLQDYENRQNSIETFDEDIYEFWHNLQKDIWNSAYSAYKQAINEGIAKEVARKLLPEGMTKSKLYMNGTVRDWIHYINVRTDDSTQLEHRHVAENIKDIFNENLPQVAKALGY